MSKTNEIMAITQEECAEVIQAISKINRFGMDTEYKERTNRERLQDEIGDLMCMFQMLADDGIIDWAEVTIQAEKKREKLKIFSNIFD